MNPIVKKIILMLLPTFIDFLVNVLEDLVKKTDNTIDDSALKAIKDNKNIIIEASRNR